MAKPAKNSIGLDTYFEHYYFQVKAKYMSIIYSLINLSFHEHFKRYILEIFKFIHRINHLAKSIRQK